MKSYSSTKLRKGNSHEEGNITCHVLLILVFTSPDLYAEQCYEQKLTIARHIDVNILNNEFIQTDLINAAEEVVDKVLSDASNLLKNKATDDDYACCVSLVREGPVDTFGKPGDGLNMAVTPSELRTLWHMTNHKIKIVSSVSVPAHLGLFGDSIPIDGQAYPGLTMVITQSARPEVWAHEFGHFKHIWLHRDSSTDNLMNSYASGVGVISQSDCELFKEDGKLLPSSSLPMPPPNVNANRNVAN